jgi:hypothetical protein
MIKERDATRALLLTPTRSAARSHGGRAGCLRRPTPTAGRRCRWSPATPARAQPRVSGALEGGGGGEEGEGEGEGDERGERREERRERSGGLQRRAIGGSGPAALDVL